MNLKALAATAVVAATSIFAPGAAKAEDQCLFTGGYEVCYRDNGAYASDRIGVWLGRSLAADITVICTGDGGSRWSSEYNKNLISYDTMNDLAGQWCGDYYQ